MLFMMKSCIQAMRALGLYAALPLDIAEHDPDQERRLHAQTRAVGAHHRIAFNLVKLGAPSARSCPAEKASSSEDAHRASRVGIRNLCACGRANLPSEVAPAADCRATAEDAALA
jgi:hypothetical protein